MISASVTKISTQTTKPKNTHMHAQLTMTESCFPFTKSQSTIQCSKVQTHSKEAGTSYLSPQLKDVTSASCMTFPLVAAQQDNESVSNLSLIIIKNSSVASQILQ